MLSIVFIVMFAMRESSRASEQLVTASLCWDGFWVSIPIGGGGGASHNQKKKLPVNPQLICTSLQARTLCKMQRRPSMASPEIRASSFQLCRVCDARSRCPSASVFSPVDLRQEEPAKTALVHTLRASVLKTECSSATMSSCFKMNQRLSSADITWYF